MGKYVIANDRNIIWVNAEDGDNYAKLFVSEDHPVMMEAAEILKAFFEAKEAGKVARLVVDMRIPGMVGGVIDTQRPKNTVIDQMNKENEASQYSPCLICKNPIYCQWGKKCSPDHLDHKWPNVFERNYPENFNAIIQGEKHERHARQQIAHMATQIFAHGGYIRSSNERIADAVSHAAEIWRLSQSVDL